MLHIYNKLIFTPTYNNKIISIFATKIFFKIRYLTYLIKQDGFFTYMINLKIYFLLVIT